jgi:flagellar biosynthetic protein FliS
MSLLARHTPHDAYRRVELDARIGGSDPRQLVTLCYETLIGALGSALHAHDRGDNQKKSESLTRALSSLTALQLGVTGEDEITWALRHLYEATRKTLLDSVLTFDAKAITLIRQDYIDILRAMTGSAPN